MKVPDEFRRFAIIGTKGMAEGDFVRGYLTAHNSHTGKKIFDENLGAAFQQDTKGHYGADQLMVKDINNYPLIKENHVPGLKVGKSGLEKTFENDLIGTNSIQRYEVNAYGKRINQIT